MATKYRLQRMDPSDGSQETNHFGEDRRTSTGSPRKRNPYRETVRVQQPYEDPDETYEHRPYYGRPHHYEAIPKPSGRVWPWVSLGVLAGILVVGVGAWMTGVSGSLAHLNQTATQNNNLLVHQSAQLTGIKAQLAQIGQELSRISQQITTFFASIMQAISSGKV